MELVSYNSGAIAQKLPPLANNYNKGEMNRINESGAKYKLANSPIPHSLPPRTALKAHVDHQSGVIDTWPAHSANQKPSNIQLSLDKHNGLVISNAQAEGKPELTPKPKFLDNLEKFLQHELKALGCDNTVATSESRLQAYREVFEYLLEEFKTYKPLLAAIKNEYEMMLALQREKIRELEPLKQMLVTLADQCDHKLMQYREEEKLEIKDLKEEKKQLMDLVSQLKNDRHTLQIQVDKLQSELALEHERFRNEQDKKKLLILDLNDMRFQQEEAKLMEQKREKKRNADGSVAVADEATSKDDPVTLKIALKVCRQNLTDAMKRLTRMEADYNDVIPRRDFIALDDGYKELEARTEKLDKELLALRTENNNNKEYTKQLEVRLSDLMTDLETTKGNSTPRPDWDRCAVLVDGGADHWKDLANNKSSIELLDTLLNELSGNNKAAPYFVGMGSHPDIPIYLRHDGKIKNRNLSKKEVCALIGDILKARQQQKQKRESSNSEQEELSDFLLAFLKKHYGGQEAYEYSYTLNESFDKFPTSELIQFFAGALGNQIDEELYFFEQKIFADLLEALEEAGVSDSEHKDTVSKSAFKDILKNLTNRKNADQVDLLLKAAEEDASATTDSNRIDYKALFNQDAEGKSSSFVINLRAVLKEQRLGLVSQIQESLGSAGTVNQNDLKKALAVLSDTIVDKYADRIVNWCFAGEKQLEADSMKRKLEQCCLYNYPKSL